MIRFFVFFISLVSILVFPETTASYPILKFFLMLGIVIPMLSWILQLYSNIPESNASVIPLSDRFTNISSYVATKRQAEIMDISQDIAIKIKKKTNVKINHWRSKIEKSHFNEIITQLKARLMTAFNERDTAENRGAVLFFRQVKKTIKQIGLKKMLSIGIPGFILVILLFIWVVPKSALPPLETINLGNKSFLIPKEWSVISHDKKMHQIIFGNQDESERIGIMNPISMSPDTFFTNAVNSEIENLELRNKKIISQYRTYHAAASLLEYDHINGERYTTLLDFTRLGKYKYKMSWIDMPKVRFYDAQAIRLLPIAANGFSLKHIDKNGKYHFDIVKPKKTYQYDTLPLLSGMFRYTEVSQFLSGINISKY